MKTGQKLLAETTLAGTDWRKRLRFHSHRLMWWLGIPGVVGVGLIAGSLALWISVIMPLSAQRAHIEATQDARSETRPPIDTSLQSSALSTYLAALPKSSQLVAQIGLLHTHAEANGIHLSDTEHHVDDGEPTSLGSLSSTVVTLKAKASPEAASAVVNHVLAEMPNSALEAFAVERGNSGETGTEIRLRIRLYMRRD